MRMNQINSQIILFKTTVLLVVERSTTMETREFFYNDNAHGVVYFVAYCC
jgi:hypothetical protein